MLTIRFGPRDLAHVRFAISPLVELHRSVSALEDPGARSLHLPWIVDTRPRVADLDLALVRALRPPRGYAPDFIHPPPRTPLAEFEDELAQLIATPANQIRAEVRYTYRRSAVPPPLESFVTDPKAAVAALAELLREYWRRALAGHWERLRALLEGDVLYRARQLTDGGARLLFADIHPELTFTEQRLEIVKWFEADVQLDGRGLLFLPSAFGWPLLAAITEPPWQPTLIYPARGVGALWEPGHEPAPEALAALLGARRATVLAALSAPRSTTELARALGLSPGSVSQHLGVLRDAGLVDGHRVGRLVLYMRSPAGEALIGKPARER
jgi:DNA-binding transcriptional ArsR family regulator